MARGLVYLAGVMGLGAAGRDGLQRSWGYGA